MASESTAERELADRVTMNSFAVNKDIDRDRMISWPRVQNLFMHEPPYTELPDPGAFTQLRTLENTPLQAFLLKVVL